MDKFAFIIHPIDPKRDVSRKFPLLGKALTVKQIKGWFVACPYTPAQMLALPEKTVYCKVIQAGRMAVKLGAQILGLGAFTSVVGDAGITIA